MGDVLRRWGPAGLSAGTQASGLLTLLVLVSPYGTSASSDAYFFLLAWTQACYQVFLGSWLFPVLLRGGGARGTTPGRLLVALPPAVLMVALFAGRVFAGIAPAGEDNVVLVLCFAVQAAMMTVYWTLAYSRAASGDPFWVSSAGLAPNLVGIAAMLVGDGGAAGHRAVSLVVGQALGAAISISVLTWRCPGTVRALRRWEPALQPASAPSSGRWFLLQGVVAYGSILGLQSVAAALPAAGLSFVNIVMRVQSGLSGALVNARMPSLLSNETTSYAPARRFATRMLIATAAATTALGVARLVWEHDYFTYAVVVGVWFAAATLNIVTKRVGARFLSVRMALFTVGYSIAVLAAVLLVRGDASLGVVLGAFVALDALPALTYGLVLRWWVPAGALTVALGVLAACLTNFL